MEEAWLHWWAGYRQRPSVPAKELEQESIYNGWDQLDKDLVCEEGDEYK